MTLHAEIFRSYDIRGIVGRTLTAEAVRDIGRALGSLGPSHDRCPADCCLPGRPGPTKPSLCGVDDPTLKASSIR